MDPFASASPIASSFWGVNVEPTEAFTNTDAASIAATPVTYVRFPGGALGEEFNYTSGRITLDNGQYQGSATTTAEFVASCQTFGCHAILQIPMEIHSVSTAVYFVHYVVKTLQFQPAYWELGNAPSGWTHYGVPWSQWNTSQHTNVTPVSFADLVSNYVSAIKAVDAGAKFLALGAGLGTRDYAKPWVVELAKVDGHNLSGISVHSYLIGNGPSNPTDQGLFSNLQGSDSLPEQISADRGFIATACPTCTNLRVFVSEINAAELSNYDPLLASFAGPLYLAAETVQGLTLQVANLDWFCYDCDYPGAWSIGPQKWQMQYYLFEDLLSRLENQTLATAVTGPSTLYGVATYQAPSGLALLLVNVNTTTAASVSLASSGFVSGTDGTQYLWLTGQTQPTATSSVFGSTVLVPPMSIVLLTAGNGSIRSPGAPSAGGAPPVSGLDPSVHTLDPPVGPGIPLLGGNLGKPTG